MTLDGQTAARDGTARWITGPEARQDTHRLRAESDAIMVGAGTLRADDPDLSVRLEGYDGPQPIGVVAAGDGPLPRQARLWDRPGTLVVAARAVEAPCDVVLVDKGDDGLPDLRHALVRLGERGLLGVMVEGGARLATALWQEDLVDTGVSYLGGLIAGGSGIPVFSGEWETVTGARTVEIDRVSRVGEDVRIDWRPARH
jgi:diaminohydroxyphosphoribosylaminopyrimidine deaminase/5-amino-6-(5-phosphoribosylamino)uracil reductase